MSSAGRDLLSSTILRGLPGSTSEAHTLASFRAALAAYDDVSEDAARANLAHFVAEIAPVAEQLGALLAIHPDDPPCQLMGLPRVVSTAEDFRRIISKHFILMIERYF